LNELEFDKWDIISIFNPFLYSLHKFFYGVNVLVEEDRGKIQTCLYKVSAEVIENREALVRE
jgi:hypothetical protein